MGERREASGKMPLSRDAVLTAIAPQVDRLIELDFHKSAANKAYVKGLDVSLGGFTSALEPRFRAQLQSVLFPTTVENSSNLLLVIPTHRSFHQAKLLDFSSWARWEPNIYPDDDLPQVPYVIEITRGSPTQTPQKFTRRAVGIVDTVLSADSAGSLNAIRQGLQKKGNRGLSIYELLAFAREYGSSISSVHGLKIPLMGPTDEQGSTEIFYPTIERNGFRLRCARTPLAYIPSSMVEVLSTPADTQFIGGITVQ
jgi:hypothetical protein